LTRVRGDGKEGDEIERAEELIQAEFYLKEHVDGGRLTVGTYGRFEAINVANRLDCFLIQAVTETFGNVNVVRATVCADNDVQDHNALNF